MVHDQKHYLGDLLVKISVGNMGCLQSCKLDVIESQKMCILELIIVLLLPILEIK